MENDSIPSFSWISACCHELRRDPALLFWVIEAWEERRDDSGKGTTPYDVSDVWEEEKDDKDEDENFTWGSVPVEAAVIIVVGDGRVT